MSKRAIIRDGKIIYDKPANMLKPNETVARERRQAMRVNHRADLLQENQVDFYKVHPERLDDLPDETKRLLS